MHLHLFHIANILLLSEIKYNSLSLFYSCYIHIVIKEDFYELHCDDL